MQELKTLINFIIVDIKVYTMVRQLMILQKEKDLDIYLKEENNEIELNMYLLDICPEYYVLNNQKHINRDFKKITFVNAR